MWQDFLTHPWRHIETRNVISQVLDEEHERSRRVGTGATSLYRTLSRVQRFGSVYAALFWIDHRCRSCHWGKSAQKSSKKCVFFIIVVQTCTFVPFFRLSTKRHRKVATDVFRAMETFFLCFETRTMPVVREWLSSSVNVYKCLAVQHKSNYNDRKSMAAFCERLTKKLMK